MHQWSQGKRKKGKKSNKGKKTSKNKDKDEKNKPKKETPHQEQKRIEKEEKKRAADLKKDAEKKKRDTLSKAKQVDGLGISMSASTQPDHFLASTKAFIDSISPSPTKTNLQAFLNSKNLYWIWSMPSQALVIFRIRMGRPLWNLLHCPGCNWPEQQDRRSLQKGDTASQSATASSEHSHGKLHFSRAIQGMIASKRH